MQIQLKWIVEIRPIRFIDMQDTKSLELLDKITGGNKPYKFIVREKSIDNFDKCIRLWQDTNIVIGKLREIVEHEKSFEEESFLYNYKGKDKNDISKIFDFFYSSLSNRVFNSFCYFDPSDGFENYNIYLKYKNKYTLVCILYGQGSTCIIKPVKPEEIKTDKDVIILDNIHCSISGEVSFYV